MALSSINAILGGRGVRRVRRQTRRRPATSSVNAVLGSRGQPAPRRSAPLTDIRAKYARGQGAAQRRGTPGYANTVALSLGLDPVLSYTGPRAQSLAPSKGLTKLLEDNAPVGVAVPEIVPPALRGAVAIHGQRLNDALKGSGMTGPEYLAKLIEFESGWDPTARNPSSAMGLGQFIDSTAQDFRSRLGVETQDPSRPKQMIKGASMHASGKYGYQPLYAGYNPGYSSTDPIPGVASGRNVTVKVPQSKLRKVGGRGKPTKAERTLAALGLEGGIKTRKGQSGPQAQLVSRDGKGRPRFNFAEMFHDPGISMDTGQQIGPIGGHGTHVHVGSEDPRSIKKFGRIAQRKFGLTVGENEFFEGEPPDPSAHSATGFHYRTAKLPSGKPIGLAIDVTGDAAKLMAYNRFLAKKFGGNPQGGVGGSVALPAGGGGGGGALAGATGGSAQEARGEEAAPLSFTPVQRSPISAAAATPESLLTSLAGILGGGEEGEEADSELARILGRRRYRPRRRR